MESEYKIDIPLHAVCSRLDGDLGELKELLVKAGFTDAIYHRAKELRIHCPSCSTHSNRSEPGLQIKFKDGRVKWTCYRCKAQYKAFDNLIGLYRHLFNEKNPWVAVNKLFDLSFAQGGKTSIVFPIRVDNYKGKYLHEVPPHKIYWTAMDASISDKDREQLFNYLGGVAPF